MSFFCANHLHAGYEKNNVVKDISFCLNEGNILGIVGANGCGKTTLLKSVCGILLHDGECFLRGEKTDNLSAKRLAQKFSYIPQRSGISIEVSALEVVLMGFNPKLRLLQNPDKQMKQKAKDALFVVGLGEKCNDSYLSLSEGQKQLCILARTLVADADLLLLDEPESALDFKFRYKILSILKDWVTKEKKGAIVTLHDGTLALNYCDELLLLDNGYALGTINPKTDTIEKMETMLGKIYGNISIHKCYGKDGKENLIMIKEADNESNY